MRTFSTLIAIVALSTFSVYAAPVHLDSNVHPTVGNVCAVVGVIHTKLNGAIPRDVADTVKNNPATPGNLNTFVPRANGKGAAHRSHPGSVKGVNPRAGGDDALHRVPTVDAIPGNVDSVVPRDGDEPPCDGEGNGNGDAQ